MKLKGCNSGHFIQAMKGGMVVKVLNKDCHGKQQLKFKGLRSIYESEDARNLYSGSRVRQEVRSTSLPFDQGEVKIEMPFQPMSGKIEPNKYASNVEGGKKRINNDLDDDSFGSMTLKEMKDRCKRKKRKLSKSDVSIKQETETCAFGDISYNKDVGTMQMKEDAELKESLICLRPNMLMKVKSNKEAVANATCTSSESSISLDRSAGQVISYQSSFENIVDLHGPVDPNNETLEPENLDSQNVAHVADTSSAASDVKMSYGGECFDKMLQEVNGSVLKMRESLSFCKEISGCVANEESSLLASATEKFGDIREMNFPETHNSLPSLASEPPEEAITPIPCYSPAKAIPVISGLSSNKHQSAHQGKLSCHMNSNTFEQRSALTLNNSMRCIELRYDGDVNVPVINNNGENMEDTSDLKLDVVESKTLTFIPDVVTADTLQLLKRGDTGHSCHGCNLYVDDEGDNKDIPLGNGLPVANISQSLSFPSHDSYPCFNPNNGSDFADDGSLTVQKHSSLTTSSSLDGVVLEGFSDIQSSDTTNGTNGVEALENCLCVETERKPPERLLSTRKVISPTSQEKLCQALDAEASCDNMETFKCWEKLSFEEQKGGKNSLMRSCVEGGDVSVLTKENIKKVKNNKNGYSQLVPRSILKVPPSSGLKPSIGTEGAFVDTCAQKAIEFSQRQMHDIESLATKLMKELKTMKDIVEETLCSEACQPTSSKYTVDQIKSAVEDVAGAEVTSRKWLSMMGRDCTRFCKIMKSTEHKSSPTSGNETCKKKKNITFADEDGGVLCKVKVYEDPQHQFIVSESWQNGHESETK